MSTTFLDKLMSIVNRYGLLFIIIWGLGLRLIDLRQPFIGDHAWNEVYYSYIARGFSEYGPLTQYDLNYGTVVISSPLVPWLMYGSFQLFGVVEWAARLPHLIFGIITLVLFYLLVRDLYGRRMGLVATFLAATLPGIVFYSRNVQLESVATCFGIAALYTLLLSVRREQRGWFVISIVCFALGVLAKFTTVLFLPALFWIVFSTSASRSRRNLLLLMGGYALLALIPSIIWVAYVTSGARQAAAGDNTAKEYFIRSGSWALSKFVSAFRSVEPYLATGVGARIWYPSLVMGFAALVVDPPRQLRRYVLPFLMALPWFLQIGYPGAWLANAYYVYPILFAICILLAALGLHLWDRIAALPGVGNLQLQILAAGSIALVMIFGFSDYMANYHSAYSPWPLIPQPSKLYSAKYVAAQNVEHQPVLTDLPFTLYYTEADRSNSMYIWWGDSDEQTIQAIESKEFVFIAYTYPPTIDIVNAIRDTGYTQIAPGAWQLSES